MPLLFGHKIRFLREIHALTQRRIAERLDILQSHVSHLEAGRKQPLVPLVLNYAVLFGTSTDYLLRDELAVAAETSTYDLIHPLKLSYPQQFGIKLRTLRLQRGWSQTQLASHFGVKQIFISFLEIGRKHPMPAMVVEIATVFGVTTDELLWDRLLVKRS